jgi:hypothetical protein
MMQTPDANRAAGTQALVIAAGARHCDRRVGWPTGPRKARPDDKLSVTHRFYRRENGGLRLPLSFVELPHA